MNPQFNFELCLLFKTQPMHLTNATWHSWNHYKHEQPTQENITEWAKLAHTWEVTQNGYSSGHSMWMFQYPMWSSALNRSGTLLKCCNLPQKNNAPHWAPIVAQGCFLLFMVWVPILKWQSQLSTQLYVYLLSQLLWSSEDGLTVYHMFCTQYGLYLYGIHPV